QVGKSLRPRGSLGAWVPIRRTDRPVSRVTVSPSTTLATTPRGPGRSPSQAGAASGRPASITPSARRANLLTLDDPFPAIPERLKAQECGGIAGNAGPPWALRRPAAG